MSRTPSAAAADAAPSRKSYFDQQRELLARDVAGGMEQVLQNINKLNRSLEGIISVGNEFSSVEALWSHFESVMDNGATNEEAEQANDGDKKDAGSAATPGHVSR